MKRALVFWFTGRPGAGKRAVARAVCDRLAGEGLAALVVDGDALGPAALGPMSAGAADIREQVRLIARLCEERRGAHDVILVPMVTPLAETRAAARAALSPGFYEIYCASAGCDAPDPRYNPPADPDLRLDTGGDPALAAARLLTFMHTRLARHPAAVPA